MSAHVKELGYDTSSLAPQPKRIPEPFPQPLSEVQLDTTTPWLGSEGIQSEEGGLKIPAEHGQEAVLGVLFALCGYV
jgi:hypothetical protein